MEHLLVETQLVGVQSVPILASPLEETLGHPVLDAHVAPHVVAEMQQHAPDAIRRLRARRLRRSASGKRSGRGGPSLFDEFSACHFMSFLSWFVFYL